MAEQSLLVNVFYCPQALFCRQPLLYHKAETKFMKGYVRSDHCVRLVCCCLQNSMSHED